MSILAELSLPNSLPTVLAPSVAKFGCPDSDASKSFMADCWPPVTPVDMPEYREIRSCNSGCAGAHGSVFVLCCCVCCFSAPLPMAQLLFQRDRKSVV